MQSVVIKHCTIVRSFVIVNVICVSFLRIDNVWGDRKCSGLIMNLDLSNITINPALQSITDSSSRCMIFDR